MEGFFAFLTVVGFFVGTMIGSGWGADEMRNKVVLYCVEKPDLCKTEYNNIKTQNKLNDYQKPEL
jgi:hypothetical protein